MLFSSVSIVWLNGRRSFLSTVKSSLEGFMLFYEELISTKQTSRLRRVRPVTAVSK